MTRHLSTHCPGKTILLNWSIDSEKNLLSYKKRYDHYPKYLTGKSSNIIVHRWFTGKRSTQSSLSSSTLKKPASFSIFIKFPSSSSSEPRLSASLSSVNVLQYQDPVWQGTRVEIYIWAGWSPARQVSSKPCMEPTDPWSCHNPSRKS